MRIAVVQVGYGDDEPMAERVERVSALVRDTVASCAGSGSAVDRARPDLVVLPELWGPTGFDYRRWEDLAEPLGESQQRLVHHGGVLAVDQRRDLLLRRGDHLRVAVPGAGDPDPGGEVEVPAAVGVVQMDALAPRGLHGGRLLEDGGQPSHEHS